MVSGFEEAAVTAGWQFWRNWSSCGVKISIEIVAGPILRLSGRTTVCSFVEEDAGSADLQQSSDIFWVKFLRDRTKQMEETI